MGPQNLIRQLRRPAGVQRPSCAGGVNAPIALLKAQFISTPKMLPFITALVSFAPTPEDEGRASRGWSLIDYHPNPDGIGTWARENNAVCTQADWDSAAMHAASDVQLTLNCEMFVQKERMGCGVVGSGRGGAL